MVTLKEFSYLLRSNETILALSTPFGRSALGIVRLSGKNSLNIIEKISNKRFEHRIATPVFFERYGKAIVTYFKAPNSYTGEDLVEISLIGNPYLINHFIKEILKEGAILALPGEFTLRAYLNGKIDLSQAEAIDSLARAVSPKVQRKLSLMSEGVFSIKIREIRDHLLELLSLMEAYIEFEEEDIEIELKEIEEKIKDLIILSQDFYKKCFLKKEEGIFNVVIAGPPNAGKSTLFNKILGYDRVLVSEEKGTTRDLIKETIDLDGFPINLWDSAGIFKRGKGITKKAIEFSKKIIKKADFILYLHDSSLPFDGIEKGLEDDVKERGTIILTKKDLKINEKNKDLPYLFISSLKEEGIDVLLKILKEKAMEYYGEGEEGEFLINERQKKHLESFLKYLKEGKEKFEEGQPMEIVSDFLNKGKEEIENVVGEIKKEEIINSIFSRFCIGK